MKYRVYRTSDWSDKKPCDGAIPESKFVENSNGVTVERVDHYINFDSLEELMGFVEKYGEIVVGPGPFGEQRIEIYDDYRE